MCILHKEIKEIKNCNLKRDGKRPLPGGKGHHDEIETVTIQALAALQDTQDFGEVISKTNDYKQALAHFTVLFGYTNLLRRLLGFSPHIMGMLFLWYVTVLIPVLGSLHHMDSLPLESNSSPLIDSGTRANSSTNDEQTFPVMSCDNTSIPPHLGRASLRA